MIPENSPRGTCFPGLISTYCQTRPKNIVLHVSITVMVFYLSASDAWLCLIELLLACHCLFVPSTFHSCSRIRKSWHHANICIHSCILVTETPESEPIEPTKNIEPVPGVEFIVKPEENQGKQVTMIPFTYLILFSLVIGYVCLNIIPMYCIVIPTFHALSLPWIVIPYPCHV